MKIQIEKTENGAELNYWRTNEGSRLFHLNTPIDKLTDSELKELVEVLHAMATKFGNLVYKRQKAK
jgi:hypothetical protein